MTQESTPQTYKQHRLLYDQTTLSQIEWAKQFLRKRCRVTSLKDQDIVARAIELYVTKLEALEELARFHPRSNVVRDDNSAELRAYTQIRSRGPTAWNAFSLPAELPAMELPEHVPTYQEIINHHTPQPEPTKQTKPKMPGLYFGPTQKKQLQANNGFQYKPLEPKEPATAESSQSQD